MSQNCQHCGSANVDTARFCIHCGRSLGADVAPPGVAPPTERAPSPRDHATGHLSHGALLANRYLIYEVVGGGGQAAVYKAIDNNLRRLVAVKEMSVSNLSAGELREAVAAAEREKDILARLRHPNLPAVYDFFSGPDGRQYLVMEFVDGVSLEKALEARDYRPFPEELVKQWTLQLCSALSYLHAQTPPIVFRDLKPANVMVDADDQLRLIDFGIARFFRPEKQGDTLRMGTPGYASPEHHSGQTDRRSDVYGLGAMLLRLTTGYDPATTPFRLPPARAVNPALSPGMAALIATATQLEPGNRFQSMEALARALDGATQPSPPPHAASARGRPAWLIPGLLALVLLLVAGGALFALVRNRGASQTTAAGVTPTLADDAPATTPATAAPPTGRPDSATAAAAAEAATATQASFAATAEAKGTQAAEATQAADASATAQSAEALATELSAEATSAVAAATLRAEPPGSGLDLVETIAGMDGMTMRLVPAGEFPRGSTSDHIDAAIADCRGNSDNDSCTAAAFDNEMPQRAIYVSAFYIDELEVSNGQYAACVAAGQCAPPEVGQGQYRRSAYYDNAAYRDYPVVWVSWFDAEAYCAWAGKRLPTEAEWEKAARGTGGGIYPWGDDWSSDRANTQDRGQQAIEWVGAYENAASPYSARNMAGNVWEYVADWYDPDYYAVAPDRDPPGPESSPGGRRVLRGGSYANFRYFARAANRGTVDPGTATQYRGIRCVLPATP